jgi:hypothetical protein
MAGGVDALLRSSNIVVQGLLSTSSPRSAFLFPESSIAGTGAPGDDAPFVFQYWPETIEDNYNPEYATRSIPGGSHPLFQWTGGSGRDITFTAQFTAEVDQGFSARGGLEGRPNAAPTALTPSARYTVDVRAALNRLRSFMLPDYDGTGFNINTLASPPKKFFLVLQGTRIGGNKDYILCILRSAPITYQACFPNGTPRLAEVSLTFSEIVQTTSVTGSSSIQFIGRQSFERDGQFYRYRGSVNRP